MKPDCVRIWPNVERSTVRVSGPRTFTVLVRFSTSRRSSARTCCPEADVLGGHEVPVVAVRRADVVAGCAAACRACRWPARSNAGRIQPEAGAARFDRCSAEPAGRCDALVAAAVGFGRAGAGIRRAASRVKMFEVLVLVLNSRHREAALDRDDRRDRSSRRGSRRRRRLQPLLAFTERQFDDRRESRSCAARPAGRCVYSASRS